MKEITIVSSDNVGALAAVAEALGSNGVNIEAISAYGVEGKAIFRIITGDEVTAIKALSRIPNITCKDEPVLIYKMLNRPGELAKITRKMANKGINIESLYIVSRKQDFTEIAIKPVKEDIEKTKEIIAHLQ